jgi:PAS domain S-box-containing protein
MRIRTRVKIGGAVTICVLLAYGALILHLDRAMSNLAQEVKEANEIVYKITTLRGLTQDFLLYRTERSQRQWAAVYAEILQLLQKPEYQVLMSEYGIGDPLNKLKTVGDTFSRLMTTQQPAGPNNLEEGAQGELQNRLTTQLLLVTQDLLTRFLNLTGTINAKLIATQRFISSLDILALALLGILLISNAVFLQRSVVKPILELHDGAEIIGAGNLDYKVGLATRDEIGQLSQAFDRMTANLQEITVSRDELAREIEVRKRAEEALRESEGHYRHLFDNMLNGYAYCKMLFEDNRPVDFIYLNVNHAFEVLTGLTDVKGKRVSEVIPGLRESDPQLFETYGKVSLTGIPEQFETYVEALDMWFSISVYSPQKEHFVAIFDVITERKQAEEALRGSRGDLNRAQAVAHTGSWRLDVQKNELTWSDENHRIFGIPLGTPMTYETFLGTVHPEDREYLNREWMAALRGEPYDIEHRIMVDDTVKWVRERAELEFDSDGQLLGGFGTTQDITERKQAEAEIKHLASFPQINPAPVLELDLSGAVTYYNQAALKSLEKLGPEAGWRDLLPEDLEEITAAARERKAEFFYREVRVKDTVFGQNIFFAEIFQVLRIYCLDITPRKQAEERLQRTLVDLERSNKELEEFAFVASHDLQEPLRKIANFSEMLATRYQGQLDERADKYLGYVADGAKRMKDLINDLLAFSRVGRADFRLIATDMNDILKGTLNDIQPLIRENQAKITHEPLPTLNVNPPQMRQLLQNLIANAIKFQGNQPPVIHLSARQEDGQWVITVSDNGIGFEPQYAEDIFKVFRRLHTKEEYPGTGIGLAICKKIVERHGGRIWAESQPGRGSTFYFTIPA